MANEPTNQELATQIFDLDKSMDEKDSAIWESLKKLGGLVGTLQVSVDQMVKEVKQTSRVAKDSAFDTKQAVNEVKEAIGGEK